MTLERPMFPPSRRGFLALTAGAVAVPTMAIVAPASPLQGPYSPALTDASLALQAAHDALMAAKAVYDAAEAVADQWERDNPPPKSRKGIKRWLRREGKMRLAVVRPKYVDVLHMETDFIKAQIAFAKVPPADERELKLMACHAVIYDEVRLDQTNTAPISRVVAYYLLKFRLLGDAAI